ncbi:hypothetical protein MTER_05170 [Mycolicibacter terrae]|uniref:Uncharacterized protein n=1 Tax=Mycolicibacter terrae TaxID=1788 RepID=A0AAD1HZM2_9MYCO|nr:hypothetical protein MTER_05170 [Mycolicibacter terrae]
MSDRHVTRHRRQRLLLEHLADQAEVLEHQYLGAVADRDAGGFLTAVLQRIQAEISEFRYFFAGGPYTEYAALFAGCVLKVYCLLVRHVIAAPGGRA